MINLLPEEYKNRIKNQNKWNGLLSLEAQILFLCVFAMIGMIGIKYYFRAEDNLALIMLKAYQDKNLSSQAEIDNIGKINQEINRVNSIIKKQISVSDYFIKVSQSLEKGMNLKSFLYKYKDDGVEISLVGWAPDNNSLSKFQENLENTFQTSINIPLDSLAKRSDIDFSFNFNISTKKNDSK
jgi:hypothetical protein